VGGQRSPHWHFVHFQQPQQLVEGSIMPAYPGLIASETDFSVIPRRMRAMQMLGVPYSDAEVAAGEESARKQAAEVAARIAAGDDGLTDLEDKQVVALIAYLDRLGTDLFAAPPEPAESPSEESEPQVARRAQEER
jgi:cytochrome c oxidase cbb3-type subunit I/II